MFVYTDRGILCGACGGIKAQAAAASAEPTPIKKTASRHAPPPPQPARPAKKLEDNPPPDPEPPPVAHKPGRRRPAAPKPKCPARLPEVALPKEPEEPEEPAPVSQVETAVTEILPAVVEMPEPAPAPTVQISIPVPEQEQAQAPAAEQAAPVAPPAPLPTPEPDRELHKQIAGIREQVESIYRVMLFEKTSAWNVLGAVAQCLAAAVLVYALIQITGAQAEQPFALSLLIVALIFQVMALTFFLKAK